MGKVLEIGISENSGGKINSIPYVEAIAGKGLINDRHHKEVNKNKNQITLIEIENIERYNQISGTSIPPINFRRNIITKGIKLNELVGAEFFNGENIFGFKMSDIRVSSFFGDELILGSFLSRLLPIMFALMFLCYAKSKLLMIIGMVVLVLTDVSL